jgi:hypothetical protein
MRKNFGDPAGNIPSPRPKKSEGLSSCVALMASARTGVLRKARLEDDLLDLALSTYQAATCSAPLAVPPREYGKCVSSRTFDFTNQNTGAGIRQIQMMTHKIVADTCIGNSKIAKYC